MRMYHCDGEGCQQQRDNVRGWLTISSSNGVYVNLASASSDSHFCSVRCLLPVLMRMVEEMVATAVIAKVTDRDKGEKGEQEQDYLLREIQEYIKKQPVPGLCEPNPFGSITFRSGVDSTPPNPISVPVSTTGSGNVGKGSSR